MVLKSQLIRTVLLISTVLTIDGYSDHKSEQTKSVIEIKQYSPQKSGIMNTIVHSLLKSARDANLPAVKPVQRKKCPFSNQQESHVERLRLIGLLRAKKFEQLNIELDRYNGVVTQRGTSVIQDYIDCLSTRYRQYEAAKEWNSGPHNSAYSECILARYLISKAWESRGSGWANSVTESGWDGFRGYKEEARECLKRALTKNPSLSPAVCAMQEIVGSGGSNEELYQWLNLGLKIEPCNIDLYRMTLHYLQPRWGGSEDALIDFAEQLIEIDQSVSPSIMSYWKYHLCMEGSHSHKSLSSDDRKKEIAKHFKELEKLYRAEIIPIYPNSVGPWVSLLGMANEYKLWTDFDRLFNEAVKLFPNEHMLYIRRDYKLYHSKRNNYKKRFDNLQKAVKILPEKGTAWYELAIIAKSRPNIANRELRIEYVDKAIKFLSGETYYPKALMLKVELLIEANKILEAEKLLAELTAKSMRNQDRLTGKLSKFYYNKKSKQYNEDKAWAYFMLPWARRNLNINDLLIDKALEVSAKSSPSDAKDWYDYAVYRYNRHRKKDYPIEGIRKAFEKSVSLFDENTDPNTRAKAAYYLGDLLFNQKKYAKSAKTLELAVEAQPNVWNSELCARAYKSINTPESLKKAIEYYRISANEITKDNLHEDKKGGWYRTILLTSSELEYKLNNHKNVVKFTLPLLESTHLSKEVRSEVLYRCGSSYYELKELAKAKKALEEGLKVCTNKELRKKLKTVEAKVEAGNSQ